MSCIIAAVSVNSAVCVFCQGISQAKTSQHIVVFFLARRPRIVSLVLTIPDPGKLVDVRQRRYSVVDVAQSTLPADLLKPGSLGLSAHNHRVQHLVTLTSVEDDALGEDLQVIWEVDPVANGIERTA